MQNHPTKIFFTFLDKIGFEIKPQKVPFKKCDVGYITYQRSRFGTFLYNVKTETITQIQKKKIFEFGEYVNKLLYTDYKISATSL